MKVLGTVFVTLIRMGFTPWPTIEARCGEQAEDEQGLPTAPMRGRNEPCEGRRCDGLCLQTIAKECRRAR